MPELYLGTETGSTPATYPCPHGPGRPARRRCAGATGVPNPTEATGELIVETARPTSLRLFDLTGRTVRELDAPARRRLLPVYDLAPDLYLVRVSTVEGIATTQKLLVR